MKEKKQLDQSGPIAYMTKNAVAANLLMLLFLVGGLIFASQVKQEVFPEFTLDFVTINMPYPGATPKQVEQGIILAIEEEVRSLEETKQVTSIANEGMATIIVELLSSADKGKTLQDIKSRIDAIRSFPQDAESPIVSLAQTRRQVISLMLSGDTELVSLQNYAEKIRDDLLDLPQISYAEIKHTKAKEIEVAVNQASLLAHGLTLQEIANQIKIESSDSPGGIIKDASGEILVKNDSRKIHSQDFQQLPILVRKNGEKVQLKDIADVSEVLEDEPLISLYNGKPAVRVDIYRVGKQTPIEIASAVKDYAKKLSLNLPKGIEIDTFNDSSQIFEERIDLLMRNAALGLILVLILLGLFLDGRLAFWVTLGIPISIMGSFLFIPLTGASINMISLFAFIVTLGIVVDDAVVVGEVIYQKREQGLSRIDAAIAGAKEISMPVVFAVLTNIAAFSPLLFVPGVSGKFFMQIPAVVIAVFAVSLLESLFVLPSHLAHGKSKASSSFSIRKKTNAALRKLIEKSYLPSLRASLHYKYLTVIVGICSLVIAFTFIITGYLPFSYLPKIDSDIINVQVTLPLGVPLEETEKVADKILATAREIINEQNPKDIIKGSYTLIGRPGEGGGGPFSGDMSASKGSHLLSVQMWLKPSDQRNITGLEFADLWRERLGPLSNVESITFDATTGASGGAAIAVNLAHKDPIVLEQATLELSQYLNVFEGIRDIDSGVSKGKNQLNFIPTEEAKALGFSSKSLGQQIRHLFYGAEALRIQRDREEVKVLVRLPQKQRTSLQSLHELILIAPDKTEIPLSYATHVEQSRSNKSLLRLNGKNILRLTADLDDKKNNATKITQELFDQYLPKLKDKYPGLSYEKDGQQKEQSESISALKLGFIFTVFLLYSLLAIPFKSYYQPLIVLVSIPFGIVGAILGHLLLGYSLSIISLFGIIALSGVVINDSMVLVVTANRMRFEEGLDVVDAIIKAADQRFRPILLTSLTTFFGLAPMIFETSMQARFLIPMAISIGFGILFATFIILILVPSLYLIAENMLSSSSKEAAEHVF